LKRHDACEITGSGGTLEIEAVGTEASENGDVGHILMLHEGCARRWTYRFLKVFVFRFCIFIGLAIIVSIVATLIKLFWRFC
jgi:hypothetical protein